MSAIDFITALGRLLRDGAARDAFAANPFAVAERFGVRAEERVRFAALAPADLEFQASVLLRKRFGDVRRVLPATCARLGVTAWLTFHDFARSRWPCGSGAQLREADEFCLHLNERAPQTLYRHEWNRLRFAMGDAWLVVHWVRCLPIHHHSRRGLQVLLRGRGGRWREWMVYAGLSK